MLEREREEEAFRRLRGRQEQFLTSYRAFLERELAELSTLARVLGVAAPGGDEASGRSAPNVFTPGSVGPGAAAAAFMTARVDSELGGKKSSTDPAAQAEPPPEPLSDLDEFFAAGDDPEVLDLAFAETIEASDDLGVTDPFAAEPFEPEPLLPEDLPPPRPATTPGGRGDAGAAGGPADIASAEAPGSAPIGWADAPGWDSASNVPAEPAAGEPGGAAPEGEDTSLLLRNAEAAGYRMPDLDTDELLLEEELPGPTAGKDDDGWLPSLLEDDDK
jgi:hypothetical protein